MARVQRVTVPGAVTWTVVDDVGSVIDPAEAFLEFARSAGYSPNTIRGYATSLSLWWTHLGGERRGWDSVTAADLARFMSAVRSGHVGVPSIGVRVPARAEATVNVRVRAVLSMYRYHAQLGTRVLPSSSAWGAESTGSFVPFLGHLSRRHAVRAQAPIVLRASRRELPVLDPVVIDRLLDAEARFDPARGSWVGDLRYRLLWLLLWQSGMRIGEALGLRHRDWVVARGSTAKVLIRPSTHPHGYRPKSGPRDVHVGATLDGLYGDYVWWLCERGADREIANWDDSFIFCNVNRPPLYAPLRVESVYAHLGVMKKRVQALPAAATPHWFRHSHATAMLMSGARIEVISRRLGHRSIQTTIDHYGHVTDDAELAAFANWESVTRGWETNR